MDNDEDIQRKILKRKQCRDRVQVLRAKRSQQKMEKERAANVVAMNSRRANMSQHETQLRRVANVDAMTSKRAKMSEHETQLRRVANADAINSKRAKMSEHETQLQRAASADAMTSKRATMSQHDTQLQRAANANGMTSKRATMSQHENQLQRAANADAMTSKRATMSQHENQLQRAADSARKKSKRANRSVKESLAENTADAERMSAKRARMSVEESLAENTADAQRKSAKRAADPNRVTRETKVVYFPDKPCFANKHKNVDTALMYLLCSMGSSVRFLEAEELENLQPESNEYKEMVEKTRVKIIDQKPSVEDQHRMQAEFMKDLAYGEVSGDSNDISCSDIFTCACCGMKHFVSEIQFSELPLSELDVLRISDLSKAKYAKLLSSSIAVPMDDEGNWGTLETKKLLNAYPIDEPVYWLHPEFVKDNEAQICKPCFTSIKRNKIPEFSLAKTQFGSLERLPDWFVKDLTVMERALLASVRMHRVVIKIQSNELSTTDSSDSALRGHYILWPHDAPEVTALKFMTLESWENNFSLEFVCRNGKLDYLIQKLLGTHMVRGRPHALYQHLAILRLTYPEVYSDIPLPAFEALKQSMSAFTVSLLKNAIVTENNKTATREDNIGDDVANVRTSRRSRHTSSVGSPVNQTTSEPISADERQLLPQHSNVSPSNYISEPAQPSESGVASGLQANFQYNANRIESILLTETDPLAEIVLVGDRTSPQGIMQDNLDALREIETRIPIRHYVDTAEKPPAVSTSESVPLNEFKKGEGGDRLLARAFPTVFMFGPTYGREAGTLTERQTKHLLCQYDNRISADKDMLAFLFDQKQRHGHLSGAAKTFKCYGGDKKVGLPAHFFSEEYYKTLNMAKDDPEGKLANRIIREWSPYFQSSGRHVKWGPLGKHEMISQIYALCRRFGAATAFVTFCPDDKNNPSVLRLAVRSLNNHEFPAKADGRFFEAMQNDTPLVDNVTIPIPLAYRDRASMASRNPVACARMYNRLLDAVFRILIGKALCHNGGRSTKSTWEKRPGLFGDALAAYGVTENTQRGSLHAHFVVWGGLPPTLLTRVAHIPALVGAVCNVLESMFITKMPRALHVTRAAGDYIRDNLSTDQVARRRPSVLVCPPVTTSEFWLHGMKNAACFQYHQHSFTCFKTKMGKCGCRMCYPRYIRNDSNFVQIIPSDLHGWHVLEAVQHPIVFQTSYEHPIVPQDDRALVLELARPSIEPLPHVNAEDNAKRLILYDMLAQAMGTFAEKDLLDFLQQSSLPSLEKVYNKVRELLPEANAMVVDFNLLLTGFIGSNTAVYHLGNVVQSNSALFYITPYMSKSNTPPGRVLSVLAKVMEEIHAGRLSSCHPDVMNGDKRPRVKDLPVKKQMQRAVGRFLNKVTAITEHHETEMAMCLLGTKTHWSTESFCYFDAKTLLPYLRHCSSHGLPVDLNLDDDADNYNAAVDDIATQISEIVQVSQDDGIDDNAAGLDLDIDDAGDNVQDVLDRNDQCEDTGNTSQSCKSNDSQNEVGAGSTDGAATSSDHDHTGSTTDGGDPANTSDHDHMHVHQLLDIIEKNNDSSDDPYCVNTVLPETFVHCSEDASIGRLKVYDIPVTDSQSTEDKGSGDGGDSDSGGGGSTEIRRVYVHEHLHHDLRGIDLRYLNPIEYISMIEIVRFTVVPAPTEKANAWFHFDKTHPLHGVYVQRLRSKFRVPILTGKQPKFPIKPDNPDDNRLQAKFRRARDLFGAYYVSIFNCDANCYAFTHIRNMQYNWTSFVKMVQSFREGETVIGRERLNWLCNTIFALTAKNQTKEIHKAYRGRNRRMWTSEEKAKQALDRELWCGGKHEDEKQMLDARELQDDELYKNLRKLEHINKIVTTLKHITGDTEVVQSVSKAIENRPYKPDTLKKATYTNYCVRSEDNVTMESLTSSLKAFEHPVSSTDTDKVEPPFPNNIDIEAYKKSATEKGMKVIDTNKPKLNQRQRLFLTTVLTDVVDAMVQKRQEQNARLHFHTPYHLIGYPGVGKTTTMLTLSRVIDAVGAGILLSTAFTGIAAALVNGVMFMRTWKIYPSNNKDTLGPTEMAKMRALVQASKLVVLVLDEFGMIPTFWVKLWDLRLREMTGVDKPFGGILVIFTGDHSQMIPMAGTSIAKSMMKYAKACSKVKDADSDAAARGLMDAELWEFQACQLIHNAKTLILDTVVRVKHREMAEMVVRIAKGGAPTLSDLVNNFKPMTRDDILKDPGWLLDATYLVLTNHERMEITSVIVRHYAKAHGFPIVRWLSKLHEDNGCFNIPLSDRTDPIFWQYFVPGAPAYLVAAVNPALKLINGTRVIQESLTFKTKAQQASLKSRLRTTAPGEYITLTEMPVSLNVVPEDADCIKRCLALDKIKLPRSRGFGMTKTSQQLPVIPILIDQQERIKPTTATVYLASRKTYYKIALQPRFAVEMRFAMTTDKAQGCTLGKTILTLEKRPTQDIVNYTHPKFLVATSRYETGNDVRTILQPLESGTGYDYKPIEYLTNLKQDTDVTAFHAGYQTATETHECVFWDMQKSLDSASKAAKMILRAKIPPRNDAKAPKKRKI